MLDLNAWIDFSNFHIEARLLPGTGFTEKPILDHVPHPTTLVAVVRIAKSLSARSASNVASSSMTTCLS